MSKVDALRRLTKHAKTNNNREEMDLLPFAKSANPLLCIRPIVLRVFMWNLKKCSLFLLVFLLLLVQPSRVLCAKPPSVRIMCEGSYEYLLAIRAEDLSEQDRERCKLSPRDIQIIREMVQAHFNVSDQRFDQQNENFSSLINDFPYTVVIRDGWKGTKDARWWQLFKAFMPLVVILIFGGLGIFLIRYVLRNYSRRIKAIGLVVWGTLLLISTLVWLIKLFECGTG